MDNLEIVNEELALAGTAPTIGPDELALDEFRVTSKTDVEEEQFLFKHLGKPCFPRKELTTVTGPAKSGKTYYTSMVMGCSTGKERNFMSLERIGEEPLKVLWYDTEQSISTTKEIMCQRIAPMVGGNFPDELFFVFNMRSASIEERRKYLAVAIATCKPDIVFVDGIADLVGDINDSKNTSELIGELMHLAEKNNCNITTMIHLNRSGEKTNLRGWLGTVLLQKCYDVFCCSSVAQSDVLSVEMTTSRKSRTLELFYYNVDENGLPYASKKPDIQSRDAHGKFTKKNESDSNQHLNREYMVKCIDDPTKDWDWNYKRLFQDAMNGWEYRSLEDLEKRVMDLTNIQQKSYYDKVLNEAEKRDVIKKVYDKYHRVAVMLSH